MLAILAVCYYGQYYRSGLNLGGEGGTAAVYAMRINEGWLPLKDMTLNYNVMWFYPVAWLFKITGPDYIALRIYFFSLCVIMAVLGFLIVRRVTGLGWYALLVGTLIVLIPGMMFRNYMGLLTLLNTWALLHAFVFEPKSPRWRWIWFAVAGLALGLTFLLRVEVGLFFLVIYLGLMVLYPFGFRGEFLRRLPIALGGGMVCLAAALAIHLPFYVDARVRGFDREFLGQYPDKWNLLKFEVGRTLLPASRKTESKPTADQSGSEGWIDVRFKKSPKDWARRAAEEKAKAAAVESQGRPRPPLSEAFRQHSFYDAVFIVLLYLPLFVSVLMIVLAGATLLWALLTADSAIREPALVCLVTLGSALTLFSQYFFFRPDTPHLSEFMVPFLVALACASFYAGRAALGLRAWWLRVGAAGFILICAATEGLYIYHAFPKESAGTIAATHRRAYEVKADNGVHVLVKRKEQPWLQALHDTIVRYSEPDEWVVTMPYSPTINFMTNRRSYLKDLYIDNATAGRHFTEDTIRDLESHRPAVIVIDQRDINDTEISRFKNWARPTYDYIRTHYVRIPTEFDTNEVYVRPDKIPPQT